MCRLMGLLSGCLMACFATPLTLPAFAFDPQRVDVPAIGGPGGGPFRAGCEPGDYLVGLKVRHGSWIDAVEGICDRWDWDRMSAFWVRDTPRFGGGGGGDGIVRCNSGSAIFGWRIQQADNADHSVGFIAPICRTLRVPYQETFFGAGNDSVGKPASGQVHNMSCPPQRAAVGLHGRSGVFVDQLGLVCGPLPVLSPFPVVEKRPCLPGFVWREAGSHDLACVPPESRARVAHENASRESRVAADGNCVSPYVWREAFYGDVVCVTPQIRDVVAQENAAAKQRTQ
jgi:hypothetical protein